MKNKSDFTAKCDFVSKSQIDVASPSKCTVETKAIVKNKIDLTAKCDFVSNSQIDVASPSKRRRNVNSQGRCDGETTSFRKIFPTGLGWAF